MERLGPGLFGPLCRADAGRGLAGFDVQMRSWFDDHVSDLAERELIPDRAYGDLPVSYDVQPEVRRVIEGEPQPG